MNIAEKLTTVAENMPKVFEAGKKSEYDGFWDVYQENGKRTNYNNAFSGVGWTSATYKPKYPIKPTNAATMYSNSRIDVHIDIDTSQCTTLQQLIQSSTIPSLGVIDARSTTESSALARTFQSGNLISVEKLILKDDGSQTFSNTFYGCSMLTHLVIEGTIGQNGLDLSRSIKLPHDNLMSIINSLQNKTSGTWTVTLGSTNLAKLTDAEKAIATQKGWTLL